MIIDKSNTNGGVNFYTINIYNLTREQAYGLPVKDSDGSIIGFVSDVDEQYIYMYIFDKDALNIEQQKVSFEIVNA